LLIRLLLITTCTLVSFFHGSNDGQKGVGLLMLILIAFLPAKFAVDHTISNDKMMVTVNRTEQALTRATFNSDAAKAEVLKVDSDLAKVKGHLMITNTKDSVASNPYKFRKEVKSVTKGLTTIAADKAVKLSDADRAVITDGSKNLNKVTDFAPIWVIATISISLGIGTMIGWKRIVVTIGEKIGNEHLNYAQGATSEIIAASTIGISTSLGLPVSTTHVLSSGIAGSMVASGGASNLNSGTLKSIAMAWILTLPVSMVLGLAFFELFRLFI